MIELEPPEDLIEYFDITRTFTSSLKVEQFSSAGENYNIVSNINQNIFLLKNLQDMGLLKSKNDICDCGMGLGNTLFEIYLQSLDISNEFSFTGIEKQKVYVDFVESKLRHLWKNNLNIINDDIFNVDYSKYNIIYSYSPFSIYTKLSEMYKKIADEIHTGSIIIEHANKGLGHFNALEKIEGLEKIKLLEMFIFKKI